MEHYIIYKEKKKYCSFPSIKYIDEDNILVSFFKSSFIDHIGRESYQTMISKDKGESWEEELIIRPPHKFKIRQINDGYCCENKLLFGAISFELIDKKYRKKLLENGFIFWSTEEGEIFVSGKLFWREKIKNSSPIIYTTSIPGIKGFLLFPRHIEIKKDKNDLVLLSGYGINNKISKPFIIQLNKNDLGNYMLIDMFHGQINGSETAMVEIVEGIIYAIIRDEASSYMLESWSYDYGRTWSYPKKLIIGHPPHLLKLKDGRILCSFGYRYNQMGIKAIVSKKIEKGSITWDEEIICLREDSGYPSEFIPYRKRKKDNGFMHVGYPVSIQLKDESILTIYYMTTQDRITHIACTKWRV